MNDRPLFATVNGARLCFGVSKTRLYDLSKIDPRIIVRIGGRSLIDVARLKALIEGLPRGPRKANGGGKGRKRS